MNILRRVFIGLAWAFGLAAFGCIGAIEQMQTGIGSGLARMGLFIMAAIASGFIAGIVGDEDE